MGILYSLGIYLYHLAIYFASFFNKKAEKWIKGRKGILNEIAEKVGNDKNIIWFHAASLGEFEQGRPVIEAIRKTFSEYKILITFFSPSGYEVRKNYSGADYIFYLPPESYRNARKFIQIVKPVKVFFIKYEFWYHYLKVLNQNRIPVYLISGIFRPDQVFFAWYGGWYRKWLHYFNYFFVQDERSHDLLRSAGIQNVSISGDTRFDRVFEIASQSKKIETAEKFKNNTLTIVCGSTWPKDEELLIKYINEEAKEVKFIIAPHEISEEHIQQIVSKLQKKCIRFSKSDLNYIAQNEVLIIDNIGMLSSIYKYGDIAYIGGGFGIGIHNILEAATFGIPVLFGPNYHKFREAIDLVYLKGAIPVSSYEEFKESINLLIKEDGKRLNSGDIAKKYVLSNQGAAKTILNSVFSLKRN